MAKSPSEKKHDDVIFTDHQKRLSRLEEVRSAEEKRLSGVRDVVATHETKLTGVRQHLGRLTAMVMRDRQCIDDTNARVDVHASHIRELRERVTRVEESQRTPVYVWVISAIVGVIAAIVWANIDFTTVVDVNDTTRFRFVYEYADAWWCAVLIGLAAFAIVWALLPRSTRRSETTEVEEPVEVEQTPITAMPPAEIPQDDTTEQMPAVTAGQ